VDGYYLQDLDSNHFKSLQFQPAMRPRSQAEDDQFRLFQAHFDQLLNPDHPLVVLANKIDWQRFDTVFADCYCPGTGAPRQGGRAALPEACLSIMLT